MKKTKTPYRTTEPLKTKIRNEFNHLSVIGIDELNAIRVSKETTSTWKRLMSFNEEEFKKCCDDAFDFAMLELARLEDEANTAKAKKTYNPSKIIKNTCNSYNPVTQYLYTSESERKRLRLVEALLTAREMGDGQMAQDAIRRSANLWYTQSEQYSIDCVDKTLMDTYRAAGIKKVKWVTERDERVCEICKSLNNEVFDIDKAPAKQHYRCRCHLIPVSEKT